MKNLTKLMNYFSKEQRTLNPCEVKAAVLEPKDLPEYQFQQLISNGEKSSEVFQELRDIVVKSLKEKLLLSSISLSHIGVRNISKQLHDFLMVIKEKLCSQVLDNITAEQIAEYLKSNNYHQNIELHIQNLFRDLSNYYTGLVLFIKLYYIESKKVEYDSYAFIKGFCAEIVDTCIDVTYFDKGFHCDQMKRYNSLIFNKSKFAEIGLNESSDLLTTKRRYLESRLQSLNDYERGVSHVDYLDNPVLRLSLLNCLAEIEIALAQLGKFNFDYKQFPSVFENIHSYLFENGYIDTSYEEFISVLFHQRGTIKWKKEQYTIVQFIGFLYVHTEIVNDIQKGFITEFFSYPKTDDCLDSAYGKRKDLGKGKRKRDDYLMLKPIMNFIPYEYRRPQKR